jgi:hypothetical protein
MSQPAYELGGRLDRVDVVYGLAAGVWISTAQEVPNPFVMR